jgi:hypothetical protein
MSPAPTAADHTAAGGAGAERRGVARRRGVLLALHHREQDWSVTQIAGLLDRAPTT